MTDAIYRVNHTLHRRALQVLRVTDLTPRMRRVTLGGAALEGFVSLGSDDHVKLLFASDAAQQAALDAGELSADASARPTMREYTPRRFDPQALELDIDFVLHGEGPASTWAAQAAPGQTLHIAGPRASLVVTDAFDSYLLIGDETAIPAIARRLEELPAGRRALVLVQVEDAQERQPLASPANVEVIWMLRHEQDLVERVHALPLPAGSLYSWVALEKRLSRAVKGVLLDKGVDEQALKAVAYWRADDTPDED
ncbi:siderophore-interacting protein [Pseudomonas sp.]|uniref:siderophore-interacting protein n=1 Tax=Pseudomonas sp. TaxID=306 RepID=UPI0028B0C1BC|nr:siderophore-interacting protein [Pseudomonas sp.]